AVTAPVKHQQAAKLRPPTLRVTQERGGIVDEHRPLPTNQQRESFRLRVRSETDNIRLEVRDDTVPATPALVPVTTPKAVGHGRVHGRVQWSRTEEAAARNRDVAVVVTANQVVHLPAQLDPADAGATERTFQAPVFLNAPTTQLRVVLQSQGGTVPQQGTGE